MKALLLAGAAVVVFFGPKLLAVVLGARELRRRRRFNPRPLAFADRPRVPASATVPPREVSAEVSHDEGPES